MQSVELIKQAVTQAKTGNKAGAKQILSQVVKKEPGNTRAWYLLSQVVESKEQAIYCLKKVLEVDPANEQAIKRLNSIDPSHPHQQVVIPNQHVPQAVAPTPQAEVSTEQANKLVERPKPITVNQIIVIVFVGLFLIFAIVSFICVSSIFSEPDTPNEYLKEYGGSIQVYEEILSMTNCQKLQEKFDIAANNADWSTPGTPKHKWSTGYMSAAHSRMQEIGCYK